MTYTFSIELPTDDVETLFHEFEDFGLDSSVTCANSAWAAENNNKQHSEFVNASEIHYTAKHEVI